MDPRQTPDARPGVAHTLPCSCETQPAWYCPRHEKAWLLEDLVAQDEEQEDSRQHGLYIDVANRALRGALKAHTPNRAKAWQDQVALVTHSDYEPRVAYEPRWGVIATVYFWSPEAGESRLQKWAPHWREAIELAVAAAIDL